MNAEAFVDTNVLLYAISGVRADREKKMIAAEILRRRDLGMSAQVLSEFYVNATRGQKPPLAHVEAVSFLRTMKRFPIVAVDGEVVFRALEIKERFQTSYWDACIIAAAQVMECRILFSEDLQNGQSFGSVTVANPF
jgi:predicted nucleic acid-binding protein